MKFVKRHTTLLCIAFFIFSSLAFTETSTMLRFGIATHSYATLFPATALFVTNRPQAPFAPTAANGFEHGYWLIGVARVAIGDT